MKLRFLTFSVLLMLLSSDLLASEICFKIFWQSSKEGDNPAVQADGTKYFVTLNDSKDVGFNKVRSSIVENKNGKIIKSTSKGCTSSDNFRLGRNKIYFSYIIGNGSPILEGWERTILKIYLPDGSSRELSNKTYQADPNRTSFDSETSVYLSMEEIDPEAAAKVQALKEGVQGEIRDYEEAREIYDQEKAKLEEIIRIIETKSFEEITPSDLENYLEAKERLGNLKNTVQGKEIEISTKTRELKEAVSEVREMVEEDLINEGYDYYESDFFDIPINFSIIIGEDSDENPFDSWATVTIEELSYLLGNEQRLTFLEKVRNWTFQADSFLETVSLRADTNPSELKQVGAAIKKVEEYIYGVDSNSGVLDQDQWFKDNPVPVKIRKDLEDALARTGDTNLIRISKSIRTWTSKDGKLTENQEAILSLSYGMWNLAKILKTLSPPKKEDFPVYDIHTGMTRESLFARASEALALSELNIRKTLREIAEVAEAGVELRVGLSPLGTVISACELLSQSKKCDQMYGKVDTVDNLGNLVAIIPYIGIAGKKFSDLMPTMIGSKGVFGPSFQYLKDKANELYALTPKPREFLGYVKELGFKAKEEFDEFLGFLKNAFPEPQAGSVTITLTGKAQKIRDSAGKIGVKTSSGMKNFVDELKITNSVSGGAFDASGKLARKGNRNVLFQGNTPTCGPTSCGMVLDTLGKKEPLDAIVKQFNIGPNGVTLGEIAGFLNNKGVPTSVKPMNINGLKSATAKGNPAIAAVRRFEPRTGTFQGHAIVVDGVTKRYGKDVVAIRDPWGKQYFQIVEKFLEEYTGIALPTKGKLHD